MNDLFLRRRQLMAAQKIEKPFHIIVNSGSDSQFIVPTMGYLNDVYNTYNWTIEWGDGTTSNHSGLGSYGSGITHSYPTANTQYKIVIKPTNPSELGWLIAFGFYTYTTGSGVLTNKNKILKVGGQLTERAIRISELDSLVCYSMFNGCTNLQMNSTFNLPQDITSVGNSFCFAMFNNCNGSMAVIKPTQFFGNLVLNQTEINKTNVFSSTFQNTRIAENISQIPQLAVIPSTDRNTFVGSTAPDLELVPVNWK